MVFNFFQSKINFTNRFCRFNEIISIFKSSANRGFAADTFIRAPIHIYIIFNTQIQIESILIDAKVNSQMANGFQLSTSVESHELFDKNRDKYLSEGNFQQIARFINQTNKNANIYEFAHRRQTSNSNANVQNGVNRCFFGSKNLANLNKVCAIRITILSTFNSSSPCLRSIKVFGRPVHLKDVDLDSKLSKGINGNQLTISQNFYLFNT